VTTIVLLCLVLLRTPVQLDCNLVALQADFLFTPVDACSVRLLFIVLQLYSVSSDWGLTRERRLFSMEVFSTLQFWILNNILEDQDPRDALHSIAKHRSRWYWLSWFIRVVRKTPKLRLFGLHPDMDSSSMSNLVFSSFDCRLFICCRQGQNMSHNQSRFSAYQCFFLHQQYGAVV
jgi:hypothetical protein